MISDIDSWKNGLNNSIWTTSILKTRATNNFFNPKNRQKKLRQFNITVSLTPIFSRDGIQTAEIFTMRPFCNSNDYVLETSDDRRKAISDQRNMTKQCSWNITLNQWFYYLHFMIAYLSRFYSRTVEKLGSLYNHLTVVRNSNLRHRYSLT